MRNVDRTRHGIPIEEAPWWALLIFTVLLWLIAFPALAGLLAAWDAWRGQHARVALAAAALAGLVTIGLATRKPWRRPRGDSLEDQRPLFARFSTWLVTALLLPNVLLGVLVLTHEPAEGAPPIGYQEALVLGALVSAVHGVLALIERAKARRRSRSE